MLRADVRLQSQTIGPKKRENVIIWGGGGINCFSPINSVLALFPTQKKFHKKSSDIFKTQGNSD